jgi:hypothetical protein
MPGASYSLSAVPAQTFDHRLLVALRTRGHAPLSERIVAAFSRTGEHAACWLALGVGGALLGTALGGATCR